MWHLDRISIAAVVNLPTQRHVSLPIIPPFSSRLVQKLIAMHLMMPPALLFAKLLNMTLFFVPTATGIYHFPSPFHCIQFITTYLQYKMLYTQLIKHFALSQHRAKKLNGVFPPPPPSIEWPNQKVQQHVHSSSDILLPFPAAIFLFVATLFVFAATTHTLI